MTRRDAPAGGELAGESGAGDVGPASDTVHAHSNAPEHSTFDAFIFVERGEQVDGATPDLSVDVAAAVEHQCGETATDVVERTPY